MKPSSGGQIPKGLLVAMLALVGGALATGTANAKGTGWMGEPLVAPQVAPSNLPYSYVAISPRRPHRITVVERITRKGGRVSAWWSLPGAFQLPALSYNGSLGGISADGATLVLSRFSPVYPSRRTGLAIIDTRVHPRHPGRTSHRRAAVMLLRFPHRYSVAAISPHGSTIYLAEHLSPLAEGRFRIRSLGNGLQGRAPLPLPLATGPRRLAGAPLDQVSGPGGRWAYTLYGGRGQAPFLLALDTIGRRARRIDLPQLAGNPEPFALALRMGPGGRRIVVLNRRASLPGSHPLLNIDTRTWEVGAPTRHAEDSGLPWPPIGAAALALLCAVGLTVGRRRSATASMTP